MLAVVKRMHQVCVYHDATTSMLSANMACSLTGTGWLSSGVQQECGLIVYLDPQSFRVEIE